MEQLSILPYIQIGMRMRYLQHCQVGWRVHGDRWIVSNLQDLRIALVNSGLTVSTRLFDRQLAKTLTMLEATPENHMLSDSDTRRIREEVVTLDAALHAEAEGKVAFIVTDRRYTVEKLLSDMSSLFPTGVFMSLPALARYDLQESGKAIAFDLGTAAAFHILRATEGVLRAYYEVVVKQKRIAEPRMWGPIIEDLRKRSHPPPADLLQRLDFIRAHYRNPTDHPEKTYDIDEVQDLLGVCTDVINVMMKAVTKS